MRSRAFPKPQLNWMQSRRGKGAFILPRGLAGWGKTLRRAPVLKEPEVQGLWGRVKLCKEYY